MEKGIIAKVGKFGEKGKYLLRQVIVIKCPLGVPNLGYSLI
jgi:hypothetical protein